MHPGSLSRAYGHGGEYQLPVHPVFKRRSDRVLHQSGDRERQLGDEVGEQHQEDGLVEQAGEVRLYRRVASHVRETCENMGVLNILLNGLFKDRQGGTGVPHCGSIHVQSVYIVNLIQARCVCDNAIDTTKRWWENVLIGLVRTYITETVSLKPS